MFQVLNTDEVVLRSRCQVCFHQGDYESMYHIMRNHRFNDKSTHQVLQVRNVLLIVNKYVVYSMYHIMRNHRFNDKSTHHMLQVGGENVIKIDYAILSIIKNSLFEWIIYLILYINKLLV